MTVGEILERVKRLKPGQYEDEDLLYWLNHLEARIRTQIIDLHEGGPEDEYTPFTQEDMQAQPLAAGPCEEMYLYWLYAMIDYHNAEEERYNNHMAMYQQLLATFNAWYKRQHMPKPGTRPHGFRGW